MARESSRANTLLVELLLVIFFFMISAAVLVQLFADARHKSLEARAATAAITEAQNCAEDLYVNIPNDPEGWLAENGFTKDESGRWTREYDSFSLFVTKESEKTESGEICTFMITGFGDGKDLFTIPSTCYVPTSGNETKEVSP